MEKNKDFCLNLKDFGNDKPEYLETLLTIGNGQFGVRAGNPLKTNELYAGNPGTFINGFFESEPIIYGEMAYGYAQEYQTICKLPNLRGIQIKIAEEDSALVEWLINLEDVCLNMRTGILKETFFIETPKKRQMTLTLVSFAPNHRMESYLCCYTFEKHNFHEELHVRHILNQPHSERANNHDPRVSRKVHTLEIEELEDTTIFRTCNSEKQVAIRHHLEKEMTSENCEVFLSHFQISKVMKRSNQLTHIFNEESEPYDDLLKAHKKSYETFWNSGDVEIKGNPMLQKGIRFNLFHLNQGAGKDGRTNFPAKGLTGEGYEGHYFWDTEMYMLPFFIFTQPERAKALLQYRVSILEKAKKRAQELGQQGALFAWRTIDGVETSAYYPAGTAQLHINADIAYAFQLYERVTGDRDFIQTDGASVIFETAKFWLSYGDFSERDGVSVFNINGVTGPDEYTALVNNNFYTNKMAQNHLRYAVELAYRYQMYETERELWQQAADSMFFGYDNERGLTKQDEHFLLLAKWDIANTPKEKFPLLLNYHPMIIYKHQVCKQADTVLAQMLFTDDFSKEQLTRDFDYYEQVTTHDSSLSRSIYSIMASRIGREEKAYNYFMDTALMDLTDLQGNVVDGVHAANMGGSWLALIYGFAGVRYHEGLIIENHLPEFITSLKFTLTYREKPIKIELTHDKIKYEIPVDFSVIEEGSQKINIQ